MIDIDLPAIVFVVLLFVAFSALTLIVIRK